MPKDCSNADTVIARAGVGTDNQFGAVIPPIYLSSTFSFEEFRKIRKYDYTRSGNPTRDSLAEALAKLEGGVNGIITSSGMSALLTVFHLAKQNDLIIAPHDCYGGTYRQLTSLAEKGFFKVEFIDQSDEAQISAAFAKKPKLFLIETPSNPLLRVVDIEAICQHKKDTIIVADNTFLSPVLQTPIALGVDLVVHSTTKYINGHSDVVGGAVISATQELHEQVAWWANNLGVTGAPLDSFLTLRGLRTIELRVKQQEKSAAAVVAFLNQHKNVKAVHYPGLPTHPGHDIAKKQQKGFGSMLSFEVDGVDLTGFFRSIELFSLAESLGGTESLIAHPASMTHAAMDKAAQEKAGVSEGLIRVSVGLENAEDLIADLERALT